MTKFVKEIELKMLDNVKISKKMFLTIMNKILETNNPENQILSINEKEKISDDQEKIIIYIIKLKKKISLKEAIDISEIFEKNIRREIHMIKWTYQERLIIII